jgi:hypothetical protein
MSTLEPDAKFDGPDDQAERAVGLAQAVDLAMRGFSYRSIADELNVHHDTVKRMLNSAEGQRLLRETREEYLDRTGRTMASLGIIALQTLGQILMSDQTQIRDKISAASKILDLQHRHAVTIEGIQPGQTVTITQDSDDLEWLHRRAQQVREVIETSAHEEQAVVIEPQLPRIASNG